jgi:hypothetical protein
MNKESEKRIDIILSILGCTEMEIHESGSISFLKYGNKCIYSLRQIEEMIKNKSLFSTTFNNKN